MAEAGDAFDAAIEITKSARNRGVLTIAQGKKIVQALRMLVATLRKSLTKRIDDVEKTVARDLQSLEANIGDLDQRTSKIESDMLTDADLATARIEIESKVEEAKALIPEATDLAPVSGRLDALEAKDDSADSIRNKLELLQGDDRLRATAIAGLEDVVRELILPAAAPVPGGIVGRDLIQDIDISDQLDGSTKTFPLPATWRVITVDLTSYPYGSLRKNIDYTWTSTSITFTDQIDAATQLSAGQKCILTVVTA